MMQDLTPFLFGYVPGYSLQGGTMAVVKTMILIVIGTYLYAYLMSFHWAYYLNRKFFKKAEVTG